MEVHVSFRGRKPVPQHVDIGMERENKVTVLCFEGMPKMDGSTAYLHIDLGKNSDAIEIIDGQADVTRTITQFTGSVEAFVEVLGANDRVWHSQIMELFVGRLPILGEKIKQEYPTAFEQALAQTAADKAAAAKSAADAAATAAGIVTEEAARQDAESKRVKAEAARETAEGKREKAETEREQKTDAAVKRADDLVKSVETKLENGEFVGAQGPRGPQGPIGETGPQGAPGAQGEKGDKGDTGATGPQGAPGTNGADGAPGKDGRDGLDAPQIDDTAITSTNPWSSAHIIDVLCPKASVSGNPVVVKDALGGVGLTECKATFTPTQAGTGTPSPDNIRPISGRDSVKVERCGENIVDVAPMGNVKWATTYTDLITALNKLPIGTYALRCEIELQEFENRFTSDTATATAFMLRAYSTNGKAVLAIAGTTITKKTVLPLAKTLTVVFSITADNVGQTEKCYVYACGRDTAIDGAPNGALGTGRIFNVSIVSGQTAPAAYTPYTGQTTTLTLPHTIYGGEVDAQTGEGVETWKLITPDGDTLKFKSTATYWNLPVNSAPGIGDTYIINIICSHFYRVFGGNKGGFIYTTIDLMRDLFTSVDEFNAYLAAQYAAGTPVQIAYKLATPVPFTATGSAEIKALDGVNTLLTDGDSITATYTQSPTILLQSLQTQASTQAASTAALERAVTDI